MTKGVEILEAIAAGLVVKKTIRIATATRIMVITPKTAARWADAGLALFKVDAAGDLFIASGRSFNRLTSGDCILVGISVEAR